MAGWLRPGQQATSFDRGEYMSKSWVGCRCYAPETRERRPPLSESVKKPAGEHFMPQLATDRLHFIARLRNVLPAIDRDIGSPANCQCYDAVVREPICRGVVKTALRHESLDAMNH